jgi:hypothetical protein
MDRKKNDDEWHLWFAWHPVTASDPLDEAGQASRAVWLQWLERSRNHYALLGDTRTRYRLTAVPPRPENHLAV